MPNSTKKVPLSIFWFRRDLRLEDNAALHAALKSEFPVLPIFIFDRNILDQLENKKDARVLFIHQEVARLKKELEKMGSTLRVFYATPKQAFEKILVEFDVQQVFANNDYEPYARARDQEIFQFLKEKGIKFSGFKDHVIFEKNEILKDDGKPYTVFTPYSRKWKKSVSEFEFAPYDNEEYFKNFWRCKQETLPELAEIGFENFSFNFPARDINEEIIQNYIETRDLPAVKGTSNLSLHLRFGTISIRKLCAVAASKSHKWLDELIWRDFYQMIIFHFPHSATNSFKTRFDQINWHNDLSDFKKWCEGKTGYEIVDAGMRELNQTGLMHNRVRMIAASFLCKHLLIDWRWGEKYFAQKLLDYDLASNVGNWQWVVGSGCDAAPYFRIFNPTTQMERFDPQKIYVKKWVPEVDSEEYAKPMVDHKMARERCLTMFAVTR